MLPILKVSRFTLNSTSRRVSHIAEESALTWMSLMGFHHVVLL